MLSDEGVLLVDNFARHDVDGRARTTRSQLQAATRDVHERLHDHPAMAGILSGSATLEDYRALLVRLYGFHSPLERAFVATPGTTQRARDCVIDRRANRMVIGCGRGRDDQKRTKNQMRSSAYVL
ncbi:MAG: biliverdin-producing heme oxygenase [Hyphomicrobiales bacterium]|nr:biliverdin-producing heme oxygenase [Hyphomicrobiales bacterium]